MPKEAIVRLTGLDSLPSRLRAVIKPAQDEFASRIRSRLIEEAPKNSGALADSIEVEVTREYKNTYVTRIHIGNSSVPYAFAVWKGLDPEIYSVNSPRIMAFPAEKWPTWEWTGDVEPSADGYFFLLGPVRNYIPPNDFIGRALTDLDMGKFIWRKYMKVLGK